MAYSTIRQKKGKCYLCSDDNEKPLTKGLCSVHYWGQVRMKSVERQEAKEIAKDDSLSTLIADLDIVYSRYMRLKEADLYENVTCYTCSTMENWKLMDLSHFISRGPMFLRFDPRNTKICCQNCNRHLSGNLAAFAKRLDLENPGIVEILQEEARMVYSFGRDELKELFADYTKKLKQLSK